MARPSSGLQFDSAPTTLKGMRFRMLCGALALLLFVAPLGASFCGDCAAGDCMLITGASEASETSESQFEGHCQETESPSEESVPCHGAESALASWDCCSITAAPEPELVAAPAFSVKLEIALPLTSHAEPPATDRTRTADWQQPVPLQAHPPLYTLHNAFLI